MKEQDKDHGAALLRGDPSARVTTEPLPQSNYARRLIVEHKHGCDCPKVPHLGSGYLHDESDDAPYEADGVWYCGRCHRWMEN